MEDPISEGGRGKQGKATVWMVFCLGRRNEGVAV